MNTLLLGGSIAFVSSLITLVVKEIFDSIKLKTERDFVAKKEFLFKLNEKAEDVLMGIQKYRDVIDEYILDLQYHIFDPSKFDPEVIKRKFSGWKEKMAISVYIYFPEIEKEYRESAKSIQNIVNLISTIQKKKEVEKDDAEKLPIEISKYRKSEFLFSEALIKSVRNKRKTLINF